LTSLDPRQGGIAAVNRNVVRALQATDEYGTAIQLRAILYHGDHSESSPDSVGLDPVQLNHIPTEACRSSRWGFLKRYSRACLFWRPRLVFVDHLHLAVVPYLCGRFLMVPYALFCHGIEFDQNLSVLRKRTFQGAIQRLSNSHITAERLEAMFP